MSQVSGVTVPVGDAVTGEHSSKLKKAAREFEAILLTQWLEKMQQSFSNSEQNQDPAHDTLSSLGTQAVATALAERGGIGISTMLLQHLKASGESRAPASQPDGIGGIKGFLEPVDK